jgi:hypothetical protein
VGIGSELSAVVHLTVQPSLRLGSPPDPPPPIGGFVAGYESTVRQLRLEAPAGLQITLFEELDD